VNKNEWILLPIFIGIDLKELIELVIIMYCSAALDRVLVIMNVSLMHVFVFNSNLLIKPLWIGAKGGDSCGKSGKVETLD
jgi:hypothetical protein